MNRSEQHIIERQILEVSTGSLEQARNWEKQVGTLLERVIEPTLERCFNNLIPAGEHLAIERLEVDLGVVFADKLAVDFENKLEQAVRTALQDAIGRAGKPAKTRETGKPSVPNQSGVSAEIDEKEAPRLQTAAAAAFETLIFLLKNGRLPWWQPGTDALPALEEDLSEPLSAAQNAALAQLLREARAARLRLAVAFSPFFISHVLAQLGAPHDWREAWLWLTEQAARTQDAEQAVLKQDFWLAGINELLEESPAPTLIGLFRRIPASAGVRFQTFWQPLVQQIGQAREIFPIPPPASLHRAVKTLAADKTWIFRPDSARPERDDDAQAAISETTAPASEKPYLPASRLKTADKMKNYPPKMASPGQDAVFVEDAGLVLLYPFLPAFFETCGLLDSKLFRSPEAAMRAARLLGWMVWSTENTAEYQLLLPKLLCGIAGETPMPAAAAFTEQELQEANGLLRAIIGHWPAVGNISADGLREGFLRRSGKLSAIDSGWRLEVERKGQDVLLSRLPWGYSPVRLPWMAGILHVNWM